MELARTTACSLYFPKVLKELSPMSVLMKLCSAIAKAVNVLGFRNNVGGLIGQSSVGLNCATESICD